MEPGDTIANLVENVRANRASAVKLLTEKLYHNQRLLFGTDENNYTGLDLDELASLLLEAVPRHHQQGSGGSGPLRDVLRLLNVLVKTSAVARQRALEHEGLHVVLAAALERPNVWETPDLIKYHIQILSSLLLQANSVKQLQKRIQLELIRGRVRERLWSSVDTDESGGTGTGPLAHWVNLYLVLYTSLSLGQTTASVVDLPARPLEDQAHLILTKRGIGQFSDYLRDYIKYFQRYYPRIIAEAIKEDRLQYFSFQTEFTFDQLCVTLAYFGRQSSELRMNMSQGGVFEIASSLLLIERVPERLIRCIFTVLEVTQIDEALCREFGSEGGPILDRLKRWIKDRSGRGYSDSLKKQANNLVESFKQGGRTTTTGLEVTNTQTFNESERGLLCPTSSTCSSSQPIVSFSTTGATKSADSLEIGAAGGPNGPRNIGVRAKDQYGCYQGSLRAWGTLDVDVWLAENELEYLREPLRQLTGRGLRQLTKMLYEDNGRSRLFQVLSERLSVDIVTILEFIAALETLL